MRFPLGFFEIAGKVVAHSILHDGPGFVGLAPSLVEYLATGSMDAAKGIVSLNDIADLELKELIEEVSVNIFFLRRSFRRAVLLIHLCPVTVASSDILWLC